MTRGTLLFLEDDRDLQSLVSTYLRERGYQVESARSVKEARDVLSRSRVDAAIVDGLLPGMSGTDFIQELRRDEPSLPILFASAFWRDLKSHELLTRQLKVARVLHKPYKPQELLVWVEQVVAPRPPPPPPPESLQPEVERDEDLTAMLAQLNGEYGARLGDKVREFSGLLERAHAGAAGALEDAFMLAHKLHGTAGSYGFVHVSAAAGRLENLLRPVRDGEKAADWNALRTAARELGQLAQRALSPHPPPLPKPSDGTSASLLGTVLVADEDPQWLAEVEHMGRERMVRVVTARTEDEAVDAARQQGLDGALLHVDLGQKEGGFQAAARLRGEDGLQSLPLAFFGAQGDVPYRVAAAHAGASLYLPRPFSAQDLMEAVERMASTRRPERSRVLVLDDDPDAVRTLSVALTSPRVEVVGLGDPFRLVESLAEHRPDLLLLDVEMPGPSGFDLCRIVRSMPEWRELPILFITAHTGVEFRVAAFQAGADDYLSKPVLREELRARVHSRLERARLARDRAERDSLTGLLLRRPFLESLRGRLAEALRQDKPLALLLLDLDRFKQVNDTHGHLAGDRVLVRLGRMLAARFRKEDLRCRWGGEEFAVTLLGETAQSARDILSRTARELGRIAFEGEKGETFHVTLSAGIAVASQDGTQVETLLQRADERLYRAKRNGRDRIEI
ncbi:response regulator [Melittangium boletus]|uniref:diguanylate cyclase n=1 Tax=Melittangium boletus DSM 14713 TaxID=1294270 RepID=A0A250I6J1_9BACT|nr:response regulator [Melittangium boletus]ATB27479.1 diguanylate cyclase [Melittangium boletus DSM 14713]